MTSKLDAAGRGRRRPEAHLYDAEVILRFAVTLAGFGRYVGVAPLGTSLTEEQARTLAAAGTVIVATDADRASRHAADRAFWVLTAHRLDPLAAHLPAGTDPSDLFTREGAAAVQSRIDSATRLGHHLLQHRVDPLARVPAASAAAELIAATPPRMWGNQITWAADRLGVDHDDLALAVAVAADRSAASRTPQRKTRCGQRLGITASRPWPMGPRPTRLSRPTASCSCRGSRLTPTGRTSNRPSGKPRRTATTVSEPCAPWCRWAALGHVRRTSCAADWSQLSGFVQGLE